MLDMRTVACKLPQHQHRIGRPLEAPNQQHPRFARHGVQAHAEHVDSSLGHKRTGSSYAITFQAKTGVHVVHVPKGANIYGAADQAGLHLPASCKQGSCSACVCKLLDGRVSYSHEPECLTPKLKAEGYVAICCASVVADATVLTHQGAKLRAERAVELDRMRHRHG